MLLERLAEQQQRLLRQRTADQLHADGQAMFSAGAGDADRRQARQVRQVGGGVTAVGPYAGGFTEFPGDRGRGGAQQHIELLECGGQFPADQLARPHRPFVVVGAVFLAQREAADDHPAAHLVTESGAAAQLHHPFLAERVIAFPQTEGHAVVAGERAGRLDRAEQQVSRCDEFHGAEAEAADLGAEAFQQPGRFPECSLDTRGVPVAAELFDQTDLEAAQLLRDRRCFPAGESDGGAVALIRACHDVQCAAHVAGAAREDPDLVHRHGQGDRPPAGQAPVGGFQAEDAAEAGGLAHAPARVGAQCYGHDAGCDGGCGAAAAAAGYAGVVVRVADRAEHRRFVAGAHGELIKVGFGDGHSSGVEQSLHGGGGVGRYVVTQHVGGGGGALALNAEVVLDGDGHAFQGQVAGNSIELRGLLKRAVSEFTYEGVEFLARGADPFEYRGRCLGCVAGGGWHPGQHSKATIFEAGSLIYCPSCREAPWWLMIMPLSSSAAAAIPAGSGRSTRTPFMSARVRGGRSSRSSLTAWVATSPARSPARKRWPRCAGSWNAAARSHRSRSRGRCSQLTYRCSTSRLRTLSTRAWARPAPCWYWMIR